MVFENGVKNIQAAAYNGAGTVYWVKKLILFQIRNNLIFIKKSPWTPMILSYNALFRQFLTIL
jgi:hypothetical protein